jgi:fructokinase
MEDCNLQGSIQVYCIGETVLDIIFRGDEPVAASPGGSMLNSAVSLGRAGIPVHLITDFGKDAAGDLVFRFLEQNGVSTSLAERYDHGKTALAIALLDERQNASYTFYKDYPANRLTARLPEVRPGDLVLFGSFYALTAGLRERLSGFIVAARSAGAFIIYDPNFRKPHLDELESLRPWILENISLASLVRGSDEDFSLIFGSETGMDAYAKVAEAGCNVLVYTKNRMGVEFFAPGVSLSLPVPEITPLSTIGAGDAFNAGIIHSLVAGTTPAGSGTRAGLDWEAILQQAIRFSENVCLSMENYISADFANALRQK